MTNSGMTTRLSLRKLQAALPSIQNHAGPSRPAASRVVTTGSAYLGMRRISSTSQTQANTGTVAADVSLNEAHCGSALAYPFSSTAITRNNPPPSKNSLKLGRGRASLSDRPTKGILAAVHVDLREELDPDSRFSSLFKRGSPDVVPSGSIVIVETWSSAAKTSSSSFSGVLMAVRRRGVSSSFTLRTLVLRLGVEVTFPIYSPLLKDIKVIQRATAGKNDKTGQLRRARRAKLYYLRKDDRRIANVPNIIKQHYKKEDELVKQAVEAARAQRNPASAAGKGKGKKGVKGRR